MLWKKWELNPHESLTPNSFQDCGHHQLACSSLIVDAVRIELTTPRLKVECSNLIKLHVNVFSFQYVNELKKASFSRCLYILIVYVNMFTLSIFDCIRHQSVFYYNSQTVLLWSLWNLYVKHVVSFLLFLCYIEWFVFLSIAMQICRLFFNYTNKRWI